jgi:hypothetical protein
MVSVDVSRENVAKVDVEWRQLENRHEFAEGIRLEIEKLRIQADKEVQQEFVRALANFLLQGQHDSVRYPRDGAEDDGQHGG